MSNLSFVIHNSCGMALNIYNNNNSTKDIKLECLERKITQLADDTTLFLRDIGSIQTMINALLLFYSASYLKLNNSKTVVFPIGEKLSQTTNLFCLQWGSNEVLALGIWFSSDISNLVKQNHGLKLEKIQKYFESLIKIQFNAIWKSNCSKILSISKYNFLNQQCIYNRLVHK